MPIANNTYKHYPPSETGKLTIETQQIFVQWTYFHSLIYKYCDSRQDDRSQALGQSYWLQHLW